MPGQAALSDRNNAGVAHHGGLIELFVNAAPSDSTDIGYMPGAKAYDLTNAIEYINTGTLTASVWKAVPRTGSSPTFANMTLTGALAAAGGVEGANSLLKSARCIHTNGYGATASTDGTNLSVGASTIMYVCELAPIPMNTLITGASVFWGDATEGNAKVALFSVPQGSTTGTCVGLSASIDVSGHTTDAYSALMPFSAAYTALGPATYYLGVICDSTSHRINTHIYGTCGAGEVTGLVYASFALAATITVPTTFTTGKGPIAAIY